MKRRTVVLLALAIAAVLAAVDCRPRSASSPGEPGLRPSTAAFPRAIVWPPDWNVLFERDPSLVDAYLARMKDCGNNSAVVAYWGTPEVRRATAAKIRSAGLLVGQLFDFNYGDNYRHEKDRIDPTRHTSYSYDKGTVDRSYCPKCRLPIYHRVIAALADLVALSQPDFVVLDVEIWQPYESIVYADQQEHTNMVSVIRQCRWCGSEAAYRQGLQEIANDIEAAVHRGRPNIPIYLWGQWDWRGVPRNRWPPVGQSGLVPTGFSGPTPHFYNTPLPAVYRARGFADPLSFMKDELAVVAVQDGYPWLTLWPNSGPGPDHVYLKPELFGAMCGLLARSGARGFALWPGPMGVSSPQYDAAREDPPRWALIQAGLRAFAAAEPAAAPQAPAAEPRPPRAARQHH